MNQSQIHWQSRIHDGFSENPSQSDPFQYYNRPFTLVESHEGHSVGHCPPNLLERGKHNDIQ